MKDTTLNFLAIASLTFSCLAAASCGESLLDPQRLLTLPELPQAWESILGEPHWQAEWIDEAGRRREQAIRGGSLEISLPQTWASAVVAWPYWPEKGIGPGVFKPAGAIFPFDSDGKTLAASWQGGVEAHFYWELAAAGQKNLPDSSVPRLPHHFDWPRFRALFTDGALNAEICADPWLADWGAIAERTVLSGFDRRRLVPEERGSLRIPVSPGPWIGSSPFAAPLVFDGPPAFPVRAAPDTWVSAESILRCNAETWIVSNIP